MAPSRKIQKKRRLLTFLPVLLCLIGLNSGFFNRASADTSDTSLDSEYLLQQGSISSGPYQRCAITAARGVQCMGYGPGGRIGDGTEIDRLSFVDVVGLTSEVRSISAGASSTCAVTIAGGAKCWGNGVGDGVPNNYSLIPVDVPGATTGVQSVEVGESGATCFLMTAGTVKCMGDNRWGTLGDGTQNGSNTLVDVVGLDGTVASINSASETTCAVMKSGVLKCWGYVGFGKAGDGTWDGGNPNAPFWAAPTPIPGMTSIASVAGTYKTICAASTSGGVKCWGSSERGTLGNSQNWGSNTPVQVTGLTSGVIALTGGNEHYCALLDTNDVKCWGRNSEGQLGIGSAGGPANIPTSVIGLTGTITAITAGSNSTCALNAIGELRCWGSLPTQTSTATPTLINGFDGVRTNVRTTTPGAYTMLRGWYPSSFSPTYNAPLTLGMRLTTTESGYVTKVLFAKDVNNTGPHTGTVWDAAGNVLAQKAFTNETAEGWQEVTLDTPARIVAGETFTVGFSLDNHIFASKADFPRKSNGPLTLSGAGGYYNYTSDVSGFPGGVTGTNYGVDLEFMTDGSMPTTTTTSTTTTTTETPTTTTTTEVPTTTTTTTEVLATTTTTTTTEVPTTTTTTTTTEVPTTTTTTSTTTEVPTTTTTTTTEVPTTTTEPLIVQVTTTTGPPTTTSSTTTTLPPTTTSSIPPTTTTSSTTTEAPTITSTLAPEPEPEPEVIIPAEMTDEQLTEVLTELESENVSEEQVAAAVDQILDGEVSGAQATELATSTKVLASIDTSQAAEIFAEIPVGDLTSEQEAELVAAVSDAPTEIKNTFEAEIDVYGDGLDEYVPVGSNIDVGGRRTLIAATTAVSAIVAGAGAVATSGPSSGGGSSSNRGPSSGGGGSNGGSSTGGSSSKDQDDFLEDTDALDINEHELDRVARRQAQKIAIAKTFKGKPNSQDMIGVKKVSKTQQIFKLIVTEISKLSFTLAGSTIVLFTLSGETRKIALIATSIAIILHFANAFAEMKKASDEFHPMGEDTSSAN